MLIPKIRSYIVLTFSLLAVALALGTATSSRVMAEPKMRIIETPLEGTNIINLRVNKAGRGRIELWCHRCKNNRIRLKVMPESELRINGSLAPIQGFSPRERDFITGFYRKEDQVLTRLTVKR